MKKVSILITTILLITTSCNKEETVHPVAISGTWKWIYTLSINPTIPDKTPLNTGIEESMQFNNNNTWKKIQNSITIDSGTYSLGHGHSFEYVGAKENIYDSIVFYKDGLEQGWDSYKVFSNDTLAFGPGWGGRFFSYTLPNNGSKWWIKQ